MLASFGQCLLGVEVRPLLLMVTHSQEGTVLVVGFMLAGREQICLLVVVL
jgi:hypothetical protein